MTPAAFVLKSESELLAAFRPKDRKHILFPRKLAYPLEVRHYYAWSEPSGVYQYLVFRKPGWDAPRGLVFRRRDRGAERNTRLCDWCHAYGPADQIDLLTVKINSRNTVGVLVCMDLGCVSKLETAASLSGKSLEKMTAELYERMGAFYEQAIEVRDSRDDG